MTNSEKLCLQWNDFKQNISTSFGDLRGDKDFTDVTLACEDGHQVEAHKVILASSSPFFKELLRKNQHTHPLIYMRALRSEDLIAIIDFLYFGEANIFQENLDSFLALAEELKLKGLTRGVDDIGKQEKLQIPPTDQNLKKEKSQKMRNSSFEPEKQIFEESGTTIASLNETGPTSADLQRLDEQISSMITKSNISAGTGKGYLATCNVCGKQGPYNSMPRHVEANHISGISHTCDICGTSSRSRNGLRHHKKDYHKDQSFVSGPGML